jgi:hypothetical protein
MKSVTEFPNIREYQEYLRTHFAGLAMQGILSNTNTLLTVRNSNDYAEMAIDFADELLKQLEKQP